MGYYGWAPIGMPMIHEIRGVLKEISFFDNDGDWSLNVEPTDEFKWILQGLSDNANANGRIECEVRPRAIGNSETLSRMLGDCVGREVTVSGSWVADCGHLWDGSELPITSGLPLVGSGADCNRGKAELHPLLSVLVSRDDLLGAVSTSYPLSRFQFLAVVDDDWTHTFYRPHTPPDSGQSRIATFSYPFPTIAGLGGFGSPVPRYDVVSVENVGAAAEFAIVDRGLGPVLQGTVVTGTTGYYWATLDVTYQDSTVVIPPPGDAWASAGITPKLTSLAYWRGQLYAAGADNVLYARDADDPAAPWQTVGSANGAVTLTAQNENLYAINADNQLMSRDASDVDSAWSTIADPIFAFDIGTVKGLAAFNGKLYAATTRDEVYERDLSVDPSRWVRIGEAPSSLMTLAASWFGSGWMLYATMADGTLNIRNVASDSTWVSMGAAPQLVALAGATFSSNNGALFAARADNQLFRLSTSRIT
jgi:hypothetical protein